MSKAAELAALIGSQTALSNRNLIINGAMQVAQRGTQTNQTTAYTACDRFQFAVVGAAVITSSQDTTVPSGQGFSNSLKLDVTTADSSLAASDFAFLRHKIEAQNLQHLNYGTSSAKSLTLSFWVRSSKTGTHIAELRHDDATYFNSQAYTISSADVWQKVAHLHHQRLDCLAHDVLAVGRAELVHPQRLRRRRRTLHGRLWRHTHAPW